MKTCDRTGICYTAQMCRKAREKDDDPLPLSSPTGVRPLPQERAGGTWGRGRSTVCGPDAVLCLRPDDGACAMKRAASGRVQSVSAERQAGTITRVTVQPSQPTQVAVFLEGTLAFEVSPDLVGAWDLRAGRYLSVEEQTRLAAAAQLLAAQATALQYLAARPRTAH